MPLIDTASVRLEGDNSSFDRSWQDTLRLVKDGATVFSVATASVALLNKGLKDPSDTAKALAVGMGSVRTVLAGVATAATAAFQAWRAGVPVAAALAKAVAIVKQTLADGRAELGTFVRDWRALPSVLGSAGDAAGDASSKIAGSAKGLDAATAASKRFGGATKEIGAIISTVVLNELSKLSGFLADTLSPDLTGVAVNAGRVSTEMVKLQRFTRDAASAFEEGRQAAAEPFQKILASMIPTLDANRRSLIATTGAIAGMSGFVLRGAQYAFSWMSTLTTISAVLGTLSLALKVPGIKTFIDGMLGAGTAARGAITIFGKLVSVGLAGVSAAAVDAGVTLLSLVTIMKTALLSTTGLVVTGVLAVIGVLTYLAIKWTATTSVVKSGATELLRAATATHAGADAIAAYAKALQDADPNLRAFVEQLQDQAEAFRQQAAAAKAATLREGGQDVAAAEVDARQRERDLVDETIKFERTLRDLRERGLTEEADLLEKNLRAEFHTKQEETQRANKLKEIKDVIAAQSAEYQRVLAVVQNLRTAEQTRLESVRSALDLETQYISVLERQGAAAETVANKVAAIRKQQRDADNADLQNKINAQRDQLADVDREVRAREAEFQKSGNGLPELAEAETRRKGIVAAIDAAVAAQQRLNSAEQKDIDDTATSLDLYNRRVAKIQQQAQLEQARIQAQRGHLADLQKDLEIRQQTYEQDHAGQRETAEFAEEEVSFAKDRRLLAAENAKFDVQSAAAAAQTAQSVARAADAYGKNSDQAKAAAAAVIATNGALGEAQAKLQGIVGFQEKNTRLLEIQLADMDRVSAAEDARAQVVQKSYDTQLATLDIQRDGAELILDDEDRQRALIKIEEQRVVVQREALEAQRQRAVQAKAELEQRLALIRAETAGNEQDTRRIDAERDIPPLIAAQTEAVKALDVAIDGTATTTAVLAKRFGEVSQEVIKVGDQLADITTNALFSGKFSDFAKGMKEALVGNIKIAFRDMLSEKLKFDLRFQKNFLQDLPGYAAQGASAIGSIFSSLFGSLSSGASSVGSAIAGLFGGGGGGNTALAAAASAVDGGGGGGFNLTQTGLGLAPNVLQGLYGAYTGGVSGAAQGFLGPTISSIFGIGSGSTVGALSGAAGGLQAGQGVLLAGQALNAAGEVVPAATSLADVGAATAAVPAAAPASALASLGAAAAAAGYAAIVAGALQAATTGFSLSKARKTFYDTGDARKAFEQSAGFWKDIGYIEPATWFYGGQGGQFQAIQNGGASGVIAGILNPVLAALALAAMPPTKGTVLRKGLEERVESKDLQIPFFDQNSGTFQRGIGQVGTRAIMQSDNLDFVSAMEKYLADTTKAIGLTTAGEDQIRAVSLMNRVVAGKKAGSEPQRSLAGAADFAGSLLAGNADPATALSAAKASLLSFGPLEDQLKTFADFIKSPDNDVRMVDAKRGFQGWLESIFDLPPSIAPLMEEEFQKILDGTFDPKKLVDKAALLSSGFGVIRTAVGKTLDVAMQQQTAAVQAFGINLPSSVAQQSGRDVFKQSIKSDVANQIIANLQQDFVTSFNNTDLLGLAEKVGDLIKKATEEGLSPDEVDKLLAPLLAGIDTAGNELTPVFDKLYDTAQKIAEQFGLIPSTVTSAAAQMAALQNTFTVSLAQGLEQTIAQGFVAALSTGSPAEAAKSLAQQVGGFIQQSVGNALAQAFIMSPAFATLLTPIQTVLATAMAEAVTGGITAGTAAGLTSAVGIFAGQFQTVLAQVMPLLADAFKTFNTTGQVFGLPTGEWTAAQNAAIQTRNDEVTALQKQSQALQDATQTRVDGLQKELDVLARYRDLSKSSEGAIEQIQGDTTAGGLTAGEQVALTRSRIDTALGVFRNATAKPADRQDAGDRLLQLLPLLLQQGGSAYQPASNDFATLRSFVLATLMEVKTTTTQQSATLEAKQQELIDIQTSADATLKSIDGHIAQLNDQISALQQQQAPAGSGTGGINPAAAGPPPPGSPFYTDAASRRAIQSNIADVRRDPAKLAEHQTALQRLLGINTVSDVFAMPTTSLTYKLGRAIVETYGGIAQDATEFKQLVGAFAAKFGGDTTYSPLLGFKTEPGEWKRVPGPRNTPRLAMLHGGEYVTTPLTAPPSFAAGNSIVFSPQTSVTIQIPPGTTIDEDSVAQKVGQLLAARDARWERELRTGGRARRIMRAAFPGS